VGFAKALVNRNRERSCRFRRTLEKGKRRVRVSGRGRFSVGLARFASRKALGPTGLAGLRSSQSPTEQKAETKNNEEQQQKKR